MIVTGNLLHKKHINWIAKPQLTRGWTSAPLTTSKHDLEHVLYGFWVKIDKVKANLFDKINSVQIQHRIKLLFIDSIRIFAQFLQRLLGDVI